MSTKSSQDHDIGVEEEAKSQEWYWNLYDLMELPGVGRKTAENLLDHGFESSREVKELTKEELMEFENIGPKTARHIKHGSKMTKAKARTDTEKIKADNEKLKQQCSEIDIPLKEVRMKFQKPNWVVNGESFSETEYAEAERLRDSEFKVGLKEIFPIDVLIKTTCLDYLDALAVNHPREFLDRERMYEVYFGKHSNLEQNDFREYIRDSTKTKIRSNYKKLIDTIGNDRLNLEEISEEFIVNLFESLSKEKICFIAEQYSVNFPEYKDGWPDLTAVKNGEAHFIEVKTSDHLRDTQKKIIENMAKPVNLNYKIHRLRPED